MSGKSTDFHKLVARFTKEERERETPDYGQVEWCPYCPGNGWSMNEIWRIATLPTNRPDPFMEGQNFVSVSWTAFQDLRNNYDYDEPAGRPTPNHPHSSLPNDWRLDDDGQLVISEAMYPARSPARKDTPSPGEAPSAVLGSPKNTLGKHSA